MGGPCTTSSTTCDCFRCFHCTLDSISGNSLADGDKWLVITGPFGDKASPVTGFPGESLSRGATSSSTEDSWSSELWVDMHLGTYKECWCPSDEACDAATDFSALGGYLRASGPVGGATCVYGSREVCTVDGVTGRGMADDDYVMLVNTVQDSAVSSTSNASLLDTFFVSNEDEGSGTTYTFPIENMPSPSICK